METLATLFRSQRRRRRLGLTRVAQQLAINQNYLEALEKGEYQKIPAGYRRLYIRDYARLLGINQERALALYRRDFIHQPALVPQKGILVGNWWSRLTNLRWQFWLVLGLIFLALGYFAFEYYRFQQPPSLSLDHWLATSQKQTLLIRGTVKRAVSLKINGQPLIFDEKGHFQKRVVLLPGENIIHFEAISAAKKKLTLTKIVVFHP